MKARTQPRTHKDLAVWTAAVQLATAVYQETRGFPATERFGMSAQMRRAATSVASNIAEGAARGSTADFRRFLCIARGSLAELETQIIICGHVGLPVDTALTDLANDLGRMLNGLICALDRTRAHRHHPSV